MRTQVTVDEVKSVIVDKLNLKGIKPSDVDDDGPLFGRGQGLGLDSVDALELVLAVESEFGIRIEDEQIGKEAFGSARKLCEFINQRLLRA